ncbi:hypothetical protein [Rhodococcus sp. MALMAid1271]|uniref:hypothetical protein n=1 Tax=Rhodococcus sp. MALMAid1271 TaxID=3411744 RepID=UPI003BA270A8
MDRGKASLTQCQHRIERFVLGLLTGTRARDVVAAAHTNLGELWNVKGTVLRLVVT